MPLFSNFSQLKQAIEKQTEKALQDDVSRVIKEGLQTHVLDNIYNASSPKNYERTYELLRSIEVGNVKKNGNVFEVQVYFNPNFTHESWYGSKKLGINAGEKISMTYIAQWLDEGKNIFTPHTEGFIDDTVGELEVTKKHVTAFIGYLKSKGIIIR